jgi:hypothetical protein
MSDTKIENKTSFIDSIIAEDKDSVLTTLKSLVHAQYVSAIKNRTETRGIKNG